MKKCGYCGKDIVYNRCTVLHCGDCGAINFEDEGCREPVVLLQWHSPSYIIPVNRDGYDIIVFTKKRTIEIVDIRKITIAEFCEKVLYWRPIGPLPDTEGEDG